MHIDVQLVLWSVLMLDAGFVLGYVTARLLNR